MRSGYPMRGRIFRNCRRPGRSAWLRSTESLARGPWQSLAPPLPAPVFRWVETGKKAAQVAADEGLLQVGDETAIATWVDEVLSEHPEEARRYLGGEKKLQGVLVGFVMKKSKGRADPKRVNQLLSTRGG